MAAVERPYTPTTPQSRTAAQERQRTLQYRQAVSHGQFSHLVTSDINSKLRDCSIDTLFPQPKTRPYPITTSQLRFVTETPVSIADMNPNQVAARSRIIHNNGTGPISVRTISGQEIII